MNCCALCGETAPKSVLNRCSSLGFCSVCWHEEPTAALQRHGISFAWTRGLLGRLNAQILLPVDAPAFHLVCSPERLHHSFFKLFVTEVEVGDPLFDSHVYVRSSDPERARALLASEGLRSGIFALLVGTRERENTTFVRFSGNTLAIQLWPQPGMTDEKEQEYKRESAAVALHVTALLRSQTRGV